MKHGVNGLVVDGSSVGEIAAAMLMLRENQVLREDLRHRGLKIASAADWRYKAETFLELCG